MMHCLGLNEHGNACEGKALKSGFCRACDPSSVVDRTEARAKAAAAAARKKAAKEAEKAVKKEQSIELQKQQLRQMFMECQSLEDVRMLGLKIAADVATGEIDPRAGSPLVQLMKQQIDLLDRKRSEDPELKDSEKERVQRLAKAMSSEDMLVYIGDTKHGFKMLVTKAREEPDDSILSIEAKEITDG
jgi:hypothetical protein